MTGIPRQNNMMYYGMYDGDDVPCKCAKISIVETMETDTAYVVVSKTTTYANRLMLLGMAWDFIKMALGFGLDYKE